MHCTDNIEKQLTFFIVRCFVGFCFGGVWFFWFVFSVVGGWVGGLCVCVCVRAGGGGGGGGGGEGGRGWGR